jgi:ferredoxin
MTGQDPLVIFMPSGRRGHFAPGTTVLDAARELGLGIESICGGRLTCGKCKVQVEEGEFAKHGIVSRAANLTAAGEAERELLHAAHADECRLSCTACITDDVLVYIPEESRAQKQIIRKAAGERIIEIDPAVRQVYVQVDRAELGEHRGDWRRLQDALERDAGLSGLTIDLTALRKLQPALHQGKWGLTVIIWNEREVIDVRPGYAEGIYGLAVDIGSTTVAAYLCDLRTGAVLATESAMNPQITYGEDLMSRVSYAMLHDDGTEKMHDAIIKALNKLAGQAAHTAGLKVRDIHELVVAGNTTMVHLFLGIDPRELGGAPFALANRDAMDIKARDLGLRLHPAANVHVLPAEAGHVGADNVAVLIAEGAAPPGFADRADRRRRHQRRDRAGQPGMAAQRLQPHRPGLRGRADQRGDARRARRHRAGAHRQGRQGAATFRVIGDERWSHDWDLCVRRMCSTASRSTWPPASAARASSRLVAELFLAGILYGGWPLQRRAPHRPAGLGRAARRVHPGDGGADDLGAAALRDAGRRAQHSTGQGGALCRRQDSDEARRRRAGGPDYPGRGVWQLHRSAVRADPGAGPRL